MATSPRSPPPPASCLFLDKLAAELRNNIYELAFTPADVEEVDFFATAPPSKALLLTCRQIYAEARQIHRKAYRSYWRSSSFHLETSISTDDLIRREWPPYKDIAEVHKLHITGLWEDSRYDYDLIDQRGIWNVATFPGSGDHFDEATEDYLTLLKFPTAPEEDWDLGVRWVIVHSFAARSMLDTIPLPLSVQIDRLVLSLAAPDPDDLDADWTESDMRQFEAVNLWIISREGRLSSS